MSQEQKTAKEVFISQLQTAAAKDIDHLCAKLFEATEGFPELRRIATQLATMAKCLQQVGESNSTDPAVITVELLVLSKLGHTHYSVCNTFIKICNLKKTGARIEILGLDL